MPLKGENELTLGLADQLSKRSIHLFELVIAVNDDSQFVSIAVVVVFVVLPLETCLLQCRYYAR